MVVRRIVANVATTNFDLIKTFYCDIFDLRIAMDLGWIVTFTGECDSTPQISFATHGGSGTAVPDISIEVDDVEEVYRRALAASVAIEYGPVTEPWGVRRFYMRDPAGRLLNVLAHVEEAP